MTSSSQIPSTTPGFSLLSGLIVSLVTIMLIRRRKTEKR
ncbi:MAG: Heimdall-CTERM domain-containing surface protein [Candidatus Hodarchaeales archaeon]